MSYPAPPPVPPAPAPTPAPSPAHRRPRTLSIVALTLGVVGTIMAFIPFVVWFAGLPLVAALILAIIALASSKHGGTGFSIGALALSVVGGIVALIVGIASLGFLGLSTLIDGVSEQTVSSPSAAPSPEESETDAPQELVVVETAFGRTDSDESTWWYVVILENPNEDHVFFDASIDIAALDAADAVLDSDSDFRPILPGRSAVTGILPAVGTGEIASLEVALPEASSATFSPSDSTGTLEVSDVTSTTDEFGTTVQGTVTGSFDQDQESVFVTVIGRDESGKIIGGDWTIVEVLPARGSVPFEVAFLDPVTDGTTFEGYAAL